MFKHYKEIWFGGLLGAAMWLSDAVMHVELGAEVHAGSFWTEVFAPHPTALIFRLLYIVIAVSFGFFLWRANWRERELRALEQSIVRFQRRLDAPALRILTAARALQNKNSVRLDDAAASLAADINFDAALIDELAKKYLEFSRLVQKGERARAIEVLNSIETRLAENRVSVE